MIHLVLKKEEQWIKFLDSYNNFFLFFKISLYLLYEERQIMGGA